MGRPPQLGGLARLNSRAANADSLPAWLIMASSQNELAQRSVVSRDIAGIKQSGQCLWGLVAAESPIDFGGIKFVSQA